MSFDASAAGARLRILATRFMTRLGFGEDSFLLFLAVLIGIVTGIAAVSFHELINLIRDSLYKGVAKEFLYGRGIFLLVVFPTMGGLLVGVLSRFVFRAREGHGIVDVVESVIRASGFQKPLTAVEKILTSALTIGSGGSAGAEGPIVQIGAAIASGVGQLFRVARQHMPILIGCGSAAGISAIFNAPFGGVLFTLEVILYDFSIRTFTPVVLASVIAQVTTQECYQLIARWTHQPEAGHVRAIFAMPAFEVSRDSMFNWQQVGNFVLLGIVCGLLGLALTRLMSSTEKFFTNLRFPKWLKPALGGAILGAGGIIYILLFGHVLPNAPISKPFAYEIYPMPAFFGDGYGVIQRLLSPDFYPGMTHMMLVLLAFLCLVKIVGSCVTLSSGGSGGIIAPSVFVGSTAGALIGYFFQQIGVFGDLQPELYALVGMGAVLSAVVHAPLASILICFELTQDYKVMVPAMLACITATGLARVIYRDSIYTMGLRHRGVNVGGHGDLSLLRKLTVEQVPLDPAAVVKPNEPFSRLMELAETLGAADFVVVDDVGKYIGMVTSDDIRAVLMSPEAIPLLLCAEVMHSDIPLVKNTDNLATVLDFFAQSNVSHLPVQIASSKGRVIGLIGRAGLMARYHQGLNDRG